MKMVGLFYSGYIA